ncbi:gamma-glutamylcyclotransferase [Microbaculum sp. FT89]|uniref:gamma-glutamylcyclotransferase n=1 Tax=Microbaculum sp. FT89 TaxID=3447298 RepID=UPI003F531224
MSDFWVFGYGSLMWRPGFDHVERVPARLRGLHRSLCVYSHVHRGTPDRPGLVLGLDRGGACLGVAFRVAPQAREEVVAYLRAREQVTMVYREVTRQIELLDGSRRAAPALCYVVDRAHQQYAGALPVQRQVELVRQGHGMSGPNVDYVRATLDHMDEIGVVDQRLAVLGRALTESV